MALTLDDADAMIEACDKHGIRLFGGKIDSTFLWFSLGKPLMKAALGVSLWVPFVSAGVGLKPIMIKILGEVLGPWMVESLLTRRVTMLIS